MNLARLTNILLSISSVVLFLAGNLLIVAISIWILWGEIEANTRFLQDPLGGLKYKCPLMLSPRETGTISATITNTINEETKPMVVASFSHGEGTQDISHVLTLAPGESQTLEWIVDGSNIYLGKFILVNIVQSPYRKLEPHQGACSMLILSLFGLTGSWSLRLVLIVSFMLILPGSILWIRNHSERDENSNKVIKMGRVFMGFVFAGMASAVFRW